MGVNRDWLILLILIALLLLGMLLTLWQGGGSRHGYNALNVPWQASPLLAMNSLAPLYREAAHLPGGNTAIHVIDRREPLTRQKIGCFSAPIANGAVKQYGPIGRDLAQSPRQLIDGDELRIAQAHLPILAKGAHIKNYHLVVLHQQSTGFGGGDVANPGGGGQGAEQNQKQHDGRT
jgi:hypothetical protein